MNLTRLRYFGHVFAYLSHRRHVKFLGSVADISAHRDVFASDIHLPDVADSGTQAMVYLAVQMQLHFRVYRVSLHTETLDPTRSCKQENPIFVFTGLLHILKHSTPQDPVNKKIKFSCLQGFSAD